MVPSLPETPEVSVTVTDGVGSGFTVIVVEAVAVQPSALVTVTVYVVVVAGETVVAAVLSPLLHTYVAPPEAVSVAEAVAQIVPSLFVLPDVSATAIEAVGV
jgi:bifunctional ADP-heptose synthase (sugar kinase/adenylyltransferase)